MSTTKAELSAGAYASKSNRHVPSPCASLSPARKRNIPKRQYYTEAVTGTQAHITLATPIVWEPGNTVPKISEDGTDISFQMLSEPTLGWSHAFLDHLQTLHFSQVKKNKEEPWFPGRRHP